jgi:hypothetical protein
MLRFVLFLLTPAGWLVALFGGILIYNLAVEFRPNFIDHAYGRRPAQAAVGHSGGAAPREAAPGRGARVAPRAPAIGRGARRAQREAEGRP